MGIFLFWSIALAAQSLSKDPWAPVLPLTILLALPDHWIESKQQMIACALQLSPPKTVWMCDGKLTKIPKQDFIFARVKTGQAGT